MQLPWLRPVVKINFVSLERTDQRSFFSLRPEARVNAREISLCARLSQDAITAARGPGDAAILRSLPGVGLVVLATLLTEAGDPLARRDYAALRTLSGVAPVTKRSGKSCIVVMRYAAQDRLRQAMFHWARVAAVHDPKSREPAPEVATYIVERMKARGILLSTDGRFHNVIKIKPPLVFSNPDADLLVSSLYSCGPLVAMPKRCCLAHCSCCWPHTLLYRSDPPCPEKDAGGVLPATPVGDTW